MAGGQIRDREWEYDAHIGILTYENFWRRWCYDFVRTNKSLIILDSIKMGITDLIIEILKMKGLAKVVQIHIRGDKRN